MRGFGFMVWVWGLGLLVWGFGFWVYGRTPPPPDLLVSAYVLHFICRLQVVHRLASSLLGPVDPSFRALSGRLKITIRLHKFNACSFPWRAAH